MSDELEDPAGKEQPHGNLPESSNARRDQQKRIETAIIGIPNVWNTRLTGSL